MDATTQAARVKFRNTELNWPKGSKYEQHPVIYLPEISIGYKRFSGCAPDASISTTTKEPTPLKIPFLDMCNIDLDYPNSGLANPPETLTGNCPHSCDAGLGFTNRQS